MNILVKHGCQLKSIDNHLITVCHVVYGLTRQSNSQVYLTSGSDGKHGENSYHPVGLAWDFDKLNDNFTKREVRLIKLTLKVIDQFYDVVYEGEKGNEHLHVEYDQRRADKHKKQSAPGAVQIQTKPTQGESKMAVQMRGLAKLIAIVLSTILPIVTKALRDEIDEAIKKWWAKAIITENPWDDFLVEFLATAFKIDLPSE